MLIAISTYSMLDKKKRSYWERLTIHYGILLFLIPAEYLRIIKLNKIIESGYIHTLSSFVLITLSLCLFIVSLNMYRSEKDKDQ